MNAGSKFLEPGADGELAQGTNLWRKGLVYTIRTAWAARLCGDDYRISVGFKRGVASVHATAGFHDVYRRVVTVAKHRVSQLTCADTGKVPNSIILGHTWRPLGENILTSLITLSLRCSVQDGIEVTSEPPPTEESLQSPGGATLEQLERLAPQRADEIYNEFDFTAPSIRNTDPITLSYGEAIPGSDLSLDFGPFVDRAETVARSYHTLLQSLGEASAQPFRIQHREWFLASQSFATNPIFASISIDGRGTERLQELPQVGRYNEVGAFYRVPMAISALRLKSIGSRKRASNFVRALAQKPRILRRPSPCARNRAVPEASRTARKSAIVMWMGYSISSTVTSCRPASMSASRSRPRSASQSSHGSHAPSRRAAPRDR